MLGSNIKFQYKKPQIYADKNPNNSSGGSIFSGVVSDIGNDKFTVDTGEKKQVFGSKNFLLYHKLIL